MDKAFIGSCRIGHGRIGVKDPKFDTIMEQLEKQSACHLGNCAPAVAGPGGARAAGTLADDSTLHCRCNVKIPRFDEKMERSKHG